MTDWKGTCWLGCPLCEDGQIKVSIAMNEGEPAVWYPNDRAYPGSLPEAWIAAVLEHFPEGACDITEITNAQIERIEQENYERLVEAADVPNELEYRG